MKVQKGLWACNCYLEAQCVVRWGFTRCPVGGIGVPAGQCVWLVGLMLHVLPVPNSKSKNQEIMEFGVSGLLK